MLKNYFKIAFRNIWKFKVFSLINIIGLSISLAVVIIIASYAEEELSENKFHRNVDCIYKIGKEKTPAPVADVIKSDIPEIKKTARVQSIFTTTVTLKYADKDPLTFKNLIFADPDFFNIFSFPAIKGNLQTALNEPMTVVLPEADAYRIFGNENPIEKTITLNNEFNLTVKAVIKDIPQNSSMKFCAVVSLSSITKMRGQQLDWPFNDYETYFLTSNNTNKADLEKKVELVMKRRLPAGSKVLNMEIFPFKDIYYNQELSSFQEHGNIEKNITLVSIAVFILLIAVINFINLSTARASTRTKEMGVRKTIGASRFSLIKQFLSESMMISFVSMAFAVFLASESSFLINSSMGLKLSIFNGGVLNRILIYSAGALLIGILAGLYPAIYLSSFKPGLILKGDIHQKRGKGHLRKILIVFQFAVTVILIVSTLVIYKQLKYLQNKPLGFQKENIIYFKANKEIFDNKNVFKDKVLQIPAVKEYAYSSAIPGEESLEWRHDLIYEGKKNNIWYSIAPISPDFMRLMGIKIVDGRNFYENSKEDEWNIIINESFTKKYCLKNPFNAKIEGIIGNGKIVGVAKDFNYKSLHSKVEPLVFVNAPDWFSYGVVGLKSSNYKDVKQVINRLELLWRELSPDFPFEYNFLDESLALQYKSEEHFEKTFIGFSFLAIFISCLGLFGLVSFTTEQKTIEIGIRKILGASISSVFYMLLKEFLKWVVIANIIACPVAYYFMNKWLQDFAYKIEISWWVFILSGGIALVIALATVSFQAIKAATANPTESLRYE
jgi:putative ABC transport system permease protein